MAHVKGARVILADYGLIRHDFSDALKVHFGRSQHQITDHEIDGWLVWQSAFVSLPQAAQSQVNTPIATTERRRTALRPNDYGRAAVFEVGANALLDVKGTGAVAPAQGDHSNGLATLGEVIREYAFEKLTSRVFQHAGTEFKTVGHYAVLDLGFDVRYPDGHTDPAGAILRQAHTRALGDKSTFTRKASTEVEGLLRRYGITSAGAYQSDPYDSINVQGTRGQEGILDYGGFLVMPWFSKPAYHIDYPPTASERNRPLFEPFKDWVQADLALAVPFQLWGFSESGRADPIADNPWIWSHRLARDLRLGKATREHAEQHLRNLLDPVEEKLGGD